MRIKDENGRIGVVTDTTDRGVYARPLGVSNTVSDAAGVTGITGSRILTSTFWRSTADGFRGLWYDSPLHEFVDAQSC